MIWMCVLCYEVGMKKKKGEKKSLDSYVTILFSRFMSQQIDNQCFKNIATFTDSKLIKQIKIK